MEAFVKKKKKKSLIEKDKGEFGFRIKRNIFFFFL